MSPPCACSPRGYCPFLPRLSVHQLADLHNELAAQISYSISRLQDNDEFLDEARYAHNFLERYLVIVRNDEQQVQILCGMHNRASEIRYLEGLINSLEQELSSLVRYKKRVEIHLQFAQAH